MEFLRKLVEIIIRKHRQLKRLYRAVFALSCIVVFVTSYALTLPAVTLDRETAEASAGIGEWEVQGQAAPESGGGTEEDQSEADAGSDPEADSETNSETDTETDAGSDGEEAAGTESAAADGTDRESADPQEPDGAADAGTAGTQIAPALEPEGTLLPEGTVLHAAGSDYDAYVTVTAESGLYEGTTLEVREITKEEDEEEYQLYFDRAQRELRDKYDDNTSLSFARFYDISFLYKGVKTEPAGEVIVRIEYEKAVEVTADAGLDTVHFDAQKEEEPEFIESDMKTEDGLEIRTGAGKDSGTEIRTSGGTQSADAAEKPLQVNEVEFKSDKFSVYGVVGSTMTVKHLSADGSTYEVTLNYGVDAGIPAGARLDVSEVTQDNSDYASYMSRIAELMEADESAFPYVKLMDISILGENGDKVILDAPVDVQIRLLDAEDLGENTQVVHFAENADDDAVEPELMENTAEGDTVSFQAASFSAYAIVKGPEAIPASDMWTKVTSLDELKEMASKGLYIGTTGGYYLTDQTAKGSQDANTTGIVKTKPAQNYPSIDTAAYYYFEFIEGTDQAYIYCLDGDGNKKYARNTGNANLYLTDEADKTAFTVLVDGNGRFRFQNGGRYWNMWNGANGNHIACWTSATDSNNYFYIWDYMIGDEDPYELDGTTFGLMYWVDGTNGKALMSTATGTENNLDALSLTVMSKPGNGAKLYVPDNSEISFWTFHHVSGDRYYLTAVVDGSPKYLQITGSGVNMVSEPDDNCRIQVVPGTGSHAGQIYLRQGTNTLAYSGNIEQGFKVGGTAGLEWLNLVEESELDNTYFMTYSAQKVSVSDESITNGSRVIVYTRIWNDTTKKYEFYAVDHDGSLVRCYESGDSIEWVGGRLNSMLWNFVEHYWEGTTDPNGYYELYNQYSEKFISPQKSSDQVLADAPIGINMSGRQNGKYYSPIVAWDDGYYAYAGLKAEGGRVVSCPISEADDFYFAIVEDMPVDDELHIVPTVDHRQYGITMKMVNFPLTGSANNDSVRQEMSDFLGSDNEYKKGNTESALLDTGLGTDGYPVTKAGNSLADWFADADEVNHLFIANTYSGTGYFEYDSTQNFAHLDESTDNFVVYRELAASASSGQFHDHGHFWPYNDIEAGKFATNKNLRDALGRTLPDSDPKKYEKLYAVQKSNTDFAPDYYMGMEVSATFTQTPDGLDDWGHDIIYEFTGDDDFWLFVDGELIIDLGGIHDALAGSVNYKTGEVIVNGKHYTLRGLFESNYKKRNPGASQAEVNEWLSQYFDEGSNIFKDYSTHTMKIYYLERGAGASNLHMRFNLASIKPGTAQLTKHLSGLETNETVLAEFPYQILYKLSDGSEHYLTNYVPRDPSRPKNYVFYKDSTSPVTYRTEYTVGGRTYNDVFILKPDETADINFPLDTLPEGVEMVSYKIVECGVNTDVYSDVKVNGTSVEGTAAGEGRKDYAADYASTEQRSRVVYDNVVNPEALTDLTVTKKLFDVTGTKEITEDKDKTVFDFRLYLATETGDIDNSPAKMHTYHVKDPQGNYCFWSVEQQRIISMGSGKSDYSALTPEEQEAATFHTSLNGSITKIPVGYTIEVRDLLEGTKFKLVERPQEIPDGYSFKKYVYKGTDYPNAAGGVADTIAEAEPHVDVHNVKGFGLRVNKVWTDADYMSERDPVYFGIFYLVDGSETPKLVPNSLRQLPYGTSSVYWYYDKLPIEGVTDFKKYVIYEAELTNPVVDSEGKVTSYDSLRLIDDGDSVTLNGKQSGDTDLSSFNYTVNYERGELSTNDNVRVDVATNSRPGIVLKKVKWDGATPLAGASFVLADEQGTEIGTYISGEDGLITEAYLRENVVYTLTETAAPQGWHGLESVMNISLNGETVTVSGVDESYYIVTQGSDTEKAAISVKDRPYMFKAVKVDSETGDPLANVGFKLYRQITVDNVEAWDPNPYPGYENLISEEDGLIFDVNTLPAGTYQLRETAPASGYQKLSGHVTFTVSRTGSVVLTGTNPPEAEFNTETVEEDGSILYTLTIRNVQTRKVSVWKTDMKSNPLTGAEFSLYKAEDFDDTSGKPREGARALIAGAVGDNGLLQLGELALGEYRLVETKAPDGYIPIDAAIHVTVRIDTVEAIKGVTRYAVCRKGDERWVAGQDDDTWQIRVTNSSGETLPITGGAGAGLFTIAGLILVAAAAAALVLRAVFRAERGRIKSG